MLVYEALRREEAGILSRPRTGHTLLNGSLARIRDKRPASCACRIGVESIQHFLFYCPKMVKRTNQANGNNGRWVE